MRNAKAELRLAFPPKPLDLDIEILTVPVELKAVQIVCADHQWVYAVGSDVFQAAKDAAVAH